MRTVPVVLLLGACAAPDPSELFYRAAVSTPADEAGAAAAFVDAIGSADTSLHVALPAGEDTALSDALVQAYDRGLEIEVITDVDLAETDAVRALLDAEVPVALLDGGLTYFEFSQNADVTFSSGVTRMSDAWVVADRKRIVAASSVGSLADGTRVVFDLEGEDLVDDVLAEHNQLFGGTDATAVDAYDAPNKSITDNRWRYGTDTSADLEVWFGPQERLTKRVVDGIYGARSSIWILTNDLCNEGLTKALQDKADLGFDVRVVVGPAFGTASSLVSRLFEETSDEVDKRQVSDPVVPTIVLLDWEEQGSGLRSRARAMVLTHDLLSASRLYRGEPVPTDQMIDGAMWVLSTAAEPSAEMETLRAVFQDHLDRSEDL